MRSALFILSLALCAQLALAADDAQLVGAWSGDGLEATFKLDRAGAFSGTLRRGGQQFPLTARNSPTSFSGSFSASGAQFPFSAILEGNTLVLRTGNTTYRLTQGNSPNPLDRPAAPAGPVNPAGPRRATPQGYRARELPQGGTLLIADRANGTNGTNLIRNAMADLRQSFDDAPQITTGFTDNQTGQSQANFITKLKDRPIEGMIYAVPQPDGGKVGIIYDDADKFDQSRPGLIKQLLADIPALLASPANVEMRDTRLPDGSGNIKLPVGWNITAANQGTVEARGPNAEGLTLGVALPITVPSGFGNGPFILPYMPPEQAIVAVIPSLNFTNQQNGGPIYDQVQVIESQRTEYPGGQAAFMVWKSMCISPGGRYPQTTFGLVITAPAGPGAWMLYVSGVYAPDDRFAAAFPSMLQSWQSWKIADRVFTERLKKTAETMRQTTQILQDMNNTQQKAFDKANNAWHTYFGGTQTVVDSRTGKAVQMSTSGNEPLDANGNPIAGQKQDLNKWIEEQNRLAGGDRFKAINPGDIGG